MQEPTVGRLYGYSAYWTSNLPYLVLIMRQNRWNIQHISIDESYLILEKNRKMENVYSILKHLFIKNQTCIKKTNLFEFWL